LNPFLKAVFLVAISLNQYKQVTDSDKLTRKASHRSIDNSDIKDILFFIDDFAGLQKTCKVKKEPAHTTVRLYD
jgi:hypothetical protein